MPTVLWIGSELETVGFKVTNQKGGEIAGLSIQCPPRVPKLSKAKCVEGRESYIKRVLRGCEHAESGLNPH